jgi:subtilisin family serine protease
MHDERLLPIGSADPLRFIDPRFEPQDPLFEPDDPAPPRRRWKSRRAALAAIAATLACGGARPPGLHATDSVLVQLAPGAAPPSRAAAADLEPSIIALGVASEEGGALLRVPLEPGAEAADAAEELARQPGVAFAEPVYLYRAARTPDDARFKEQWGLPKISAPAVWARTTGSASTVVAVIDDGITLDHPDLAPNLWTNPDEHGLDEDGNGIVDLHGASFIDGTTTGDPTPVAQTTTSFHGSHVAGVIAAAGNNRIGVSGVSWHASLMGLRAFGPSGGRSDDLARAVDYAVDHGARIIDASWSGAGVSRVLREAIERAGKKGVLFVAAAGNDSAKGPRFPANLALDNLISVGASDNSDALASFSNGGAMIAAPGIGILSTTAAGLYARYDGTSMASAHVAGVAALLWAAHPKATLLQVRKAILDSGVEMEGTEHGRIDASRALSALDAQEESPPGSLALSRDSLTFVSQAGRRPKPQSVSIRVEGGGARSWSAHSDAPWLKLSIDQGETPARVSIRVDPSHGNDDALVVFKDELGGTATLTVSLRPASLAVTGKGCELKADGKLHVQLGAGCALAASEHSQWTLPDGREMSGQRLYAQFVRRGELQLLIRGSDAVGDPLTVVIE